MKSAAYARYSTDRQNENSIDTQLAAINYYCQQNDHEIVATFVDMGLTGTNTERPEFQRMLEAAKSGQFEAVVIYDLTRGSRDVVDWFSFRKDMQRVGVQVLSTTETLGSLDDPSAFLSELLTAGLGQHMVLQTRQKSMAGIAQRAKEGVFLGGIPPLGYDIEAERYVINESEAKVVKKIFSMYANGDSYNVIIDALGGARGKRGRPLGKNSLHSILTNERYIGTYSWNKRTVKYFGHWAGGKPNPNAVRKENQIPPIVDKDTWERVRVRMGDNKRRAANKAKRDYLLSGLIVCEKCGATYVGHTSTNKRGYEHTTYVCGNKYRTRTCDAKNIAANEIEPFVAIHLQDYLLKADFRETAEEVAKAYNSRSKNLHSERMELADVETRIRNCQTVLARRPDLIEMEEMMDELRGRKSELEDLIKSAESGIKRIDVDALVKMFEDSITSWDAGLKKEVIRRHVSTIDAHADGTFTVNMGVHIMVAGAGFEPTTFGL